MSKDPAILLYTGDFLNGCVDLTFEERGQYITLLCLQHQKGHLSEKTIRLAVGSVSVDVLKKFIKDESGNYYNCRMDNEIQKRLQFIQTRIDNGSKGGRPKKPNGKPNGKPKKKLIEDIDRNGINIGFENFWDLYDKKRGDKNKLEMKWISLTDEERQKIIDYIPKYKLSQPNKTYRKDPQTFFNNKSWNDEIIMSNENNSRGNKRSVKRINDEWN